MVQDYQLPKLYAPTNGTWRVYWYNRHPHTGELTRIQKTFNINRVKNKRARRRVASEHIARLSAMLKNGFNYFTDIEGLIPIDDHVQQQMSIHELVNKILPEQLAGKKRRTIQTYTSYVTQFCQWLELVELVSLPASEFTETYFQSFIEWKKDTSGCGNKKLNDYTSFFNNTFKRATKKKIIPANPIQDPDYLPESDSTTFQEFTAIELQTIAQHLQKVNNRYYIYTKFTAMEFIRPYHIAFLKASDIDYERNLIRITPESSKNRKGKYKQLFPELKKLLIDNEYHTLPGDWYLFGKGFEPSKEQYINLSVRSAELWRKEVIEHLGINKKMYGLKHTASMYYVNENEHVDAAWLQQHMEHHSLSETETYIKNRKTKKIDPDNTNFMQY